jgi:HSP20 family protein
MTSLMPIPEYVLETHDFFDTWKRFEIALPDASARQPKVAYDLQLVIPGMEKEDFTIRVKGNVLSIRTAGEREHDTEGRGYSNREFSFLGLERRFRIPEDVRTDGIMAHYHQGVLYLLFPKGEAASQEETLEVALV